MVLNIFLVIFLDILKARSAILQNVFQFRFVWFFLHNLTKDFGQEYYIGDILSSVHLIKDMMPGDPDTDD